MVVMSERGGKKTDSFGLHLFILLKPCKTPRSRGIKNPRINRRIAFSQCPACISWKRLDRNDAMLALIRQHLATFWSSEAYQVGSNCMEHKENRQGAMLF